MGATVACIAGEEIHRQWQAGRLSGENLGPRETPFGPSTEIFFVEDDGQSFYLLPRHGAGLDKTAPRKINYRANMYAIKDLGAQHVLAWGPGGAITHNIAVGDLVILTDVIDRTYLRAKTFFENSPLGFLRQFPVFCPMLRQTVDNVLDDMKLVHHNASTAAVCEGPRLETPAEVRMLAGIGSEIVTHTFVPEVFLAKELELCYAAVCYVVNYAEAGSRHRPFAPGDLFGGLTHATDSERLAGAVAAMSRIVRNVTAALKDSEKTCECDRTMEANRREYGLGDNWRAWFV